MTCADCHPVEVINSTLAPPTTCHAFTFSIPKHDTLAAIARTRIETALPANGVNTQATSNFSGAGEDSVVQQSPSGQNLRNMSAATELTFHGVTLTVWTHCDNNKVQHLQHLKENRDKIKAGIYDSTRSDVYKNRGPMASVERVQSAKWRKSTPWGKSKRAPSDGDVTASETEAGMSDSDPEGLMRRRTTRRIKKETNLDGVEEWPDDTAAIFEDGGDVFWTPFAITLVSRHPIYDVMQDYLRLSWARYSKNAKFHMTQICRILNHENPRPGELYRLAVSCGGDESISVEATMPGALDFERGIVKVDYQMWPLFQAVDVDHILTCAEVSTFLGSDSR